MKIKSLLIGMLACSALVACTNDDLLEDNENLENGKVEQSYISVNLVNPVAKSRAFQDGDDNEQEVKRARFYLFNSDGSAYQINDATGTKNFVDTDVDELNLDPTYNSGSDNVETICQAVLVIDKSKKEPPTSIVAVLNYPLDSNGECLWGDGEKSLTDLTSAAMAYNHGTIKTEAGVEKPYNSKGNFVMTNSVYVDEGNNRTVMKATPIAANNIQATAQKANENAVEIYVERIAAKVEVTMTSSFTKGNDGFYTISTGLTDANKKEITAKILGWKVTNITDKSYLLKNLSSNYTSFNGHVGAATSWVWNDEGNFRSYWANTTDLSTPTHPWIFDDVTNGFEETNNWEYYNENTHSTTHSQLLVVAEFIVDGKATPIAEWYGVKYTYAGLQQVVANALAKKIYTRTGTEGNYKYNSITPAAISFKQDPSSKESDRYLSRAVVEFVENTYFDENQTVYDEEGLKEVLATVHPAKIWGNEIAKEDGSKTYVGGGYYYIDIVQNDGKITKDAEGKVTSDTNVYGLVRNHWYQITLSDLNGLGTPVYNPDEIIKTEKPDTDESYIAAKIKVLAWNIKSQSVTLE